MEWLDLVMPTFCKRSKSSVDPFEVGRTRRELSHHCWQIRNEAGRLNMTSCRLLTCLEWHPQVPSCQSVGEPTQQMGESRGRAMVRHKIHNNNKYIWWSDCFLNAHYCSKWHWMYIWTLVCSKSEVYVLPVVGDSFSVRPCWSSMGEDQKDVHPLLELL